jgi:hypothetical protein
MKNTLTILLLLVVQITFSQIPFYQDIFRGSASISTIGNNYFGGQESLSYNMQNPMGYQIKKSFIFVSQDGSGFNFNFDFNNLTYILDENSKVESGFSSFGSGTSGFHNSSIHCFDVTSNMNSNQNIYVLDIPSYSPNQSNSLFSSFTLVVFYQSNNLELLSTSIVLNNKNVDTLIEYNLIDINPINNFFPVSLSCVSSYICDTTIDGSYVTVNNNDIGLIGGKDSNTNNNCSGVYGCFKHYDNVSYGLDDDTSDSLMSGTDALADIKSYLNNGDKEVSVSFLYQTLNSQIDPYTNPVRYLFLAHSTKCDTLKSRINISDTTICAGEVLNLTVGGDNTYSYAWRYKGNVVTTDSVLIITPEENRLYSIMVSDTNGCSKTEIINIKVNQNPRLFIRTQDADCPNSNGAIVIDSVQGIANPYRYRKDLGPWQTAPVYGGLSAGNYTISAIDTNSCMATEVVTINELNNTVANFSYESPLPFVPTEVTFTNQSLNASEYQWFVNSDLVSNQTNLAQLFELAGVHSITLVASKLNEQCADTLVKTINLERENYLYLPSTWGKESPLNLYSIGYVKVAFRLLNSLGQVVHVVSTPIASEEQNLLGNKNFARGVYFYELTATKVTGEEVKVGGKLIRM